METELDKKLSKLAPVVSAEEIAKILRVTRQSVTRWANEGRLPCLQPGERVMRFRKEDVIAFIENSFIDK